MKAEYNITEEYHAIQQQLSQVPPGTVLFQHPDGSAFSPPFDQLEIQTQGKGLVQWIPLFPGIQLSHYFYTAPQVIFRHPAKEWMLQVDYCLQGQVGWNMGEEIETYLGKEDLCIRSMAGSDDTRMILPLGYCHGITLTFDIETIRTNDPESTQELVWSLRTQYIKFCGLKTAVAISVSKELGQTLSSLYNPPPEQQYPRYYKMKILWLLLYLSELKITPGLAHIPCSTWLTQQMEQIRDVLVQHPDRRYSTRQLAKTYHINNDTLKRCFKKVYGMPVAAYAKVCRMQRAQQLLCQTDADLAHIARQVGCRSQGKFTRAFRKHTGLLPEEYRRQHQTSAL